MADEVISLSGTFADLKTLSHWLTEQRKDQSLMRDLPTSVLARVWVERVRSTDELPV